MGKLSIAQSQLFVEVQFILDNILSKYIDINERNQARLSVLEICSAKIGGFDIGDYRRSVRWSATELPQDIPINLLVSSIKKIQLPHSVVLSILSIDDFELRNQKTSGAYYTDFRLADALLQPILKEISSLITIPKVVDLAVGSGILLATLASQLPETISINNFLANGVYGADISDTALRAVCLSLSCHTNSIDVISSLCSHLICTNSLTINRSIWHNLAPKGFDFVVGNPPWEKLKLNIHEYLISNGHERHYGQEIDQVSEWHMLSQEKLRLKKYATAIKRLTPDNQGEVDLYAPFLRLAYDITKEGGFIAQIIPAAFIRTQGATPLRSYILSVSESLHLTLLDNKPRFFDIDTRFKFLLLNSRKGTDCQTIFLQHASADRNKVNANSGVTIGAYELSRIRPDLSLPEVRTEIEWNIFRRIAYAFPKFGKEGIQWQHTFHREIDMTLNKNLFSHDKNETSIPLIEGRMVHQFSFGAKAYISGSGRKAIWEESYAYNANDLSPQFYINEKLLPTRIRNRTRKLRVGFCDITGQTNERTMLASVIPNGIVCGNKVPTIDFLLEKSIPSLIYLWVGFANSFIFDWLLRRVITTNVNFFILDSIPVPEPDFRLAAHKDIADYTLALTTASADPFNWQTAQIRARIDALSALAYNISYEEYAMILEDFTSLDRLQPLIKGEEKCFVTRDLALLTFLEMTNPQHPDIAYLTNSINHYKRIGAVPYIPSQFKESLTLNHV